MYHPKKKPPNRILWTIVAGIVFLHVGALAIFGGLTLYEAIRPTDPTFDEPPPAEKIERVQLEYKVRMKEKQRQSARPQQKLQVQSVEDMNMPDMDVQVPNLGNTGNIGRFGDDRFGGLGGGGGLGIGEISVELFDLRSKGEKFLFVIDVRRDLMQDAKGGLPSYQVIKDEVLELIDDLPAGVLFNVMLFDGIRIEAWRSQLMPATSGNKNDVRNWLAPVNSSANRIGLRRVNYRPKAWNEELPRNLLRSAGGRNAIYLLAMALIEQRPDAIYLFTDSLPAIEDTTYATYDAEQAREAREEFIEEVEDAGFDSVAEYRRARAQVNARVNRKVQEFKAREQRQRAEEGKPPRVYSASEERALRRRMEREVEEEFDDYVEPIGQDSARVRNEIDERAIRAAFERLLRLHYDQNNFERPRLNAVIFKGADEEWSKRQEDRVEDFVDFFDGDHRVLKGLGAIETEKYQD